MSYNPNIPQAASKRAISAQQIRSNYQFIANAFAENHKPLTTDASVRGMHTVLILRPQVGDPTTSANEVALYNKLVSTVPNLFFRPRNNGTPIQMTYPSIQTGLQSTNPNVYFPRQYSFVAGPFVIYGGLITNPTDGDIVTLLPSTTLRYVNLMTKDFKGTVGGSVVPTSIAGNQFTIRFQTQASSTRDVYYFAVGN